MVVGTSIANRLQPGTEALIGHFVNLTNQHIIQYTDVTARRIEVNTPNGPVSYPAPAAIVVDQPRHYGAVPGIGDPTKIAKPPHVRTQSS